MCFLLQLDLLNHIGELSQHCIVVICWVVYQPVHFLISNTNVAPFHGQKYLPALFCNWVVRFQRARHQIMRARTVSEAADVVQKRNSCCPDRNLRESTAYYVLVSCYEVFCRCFGPSVASTTLSVLIFATIWRNVVRFYIWVIDLR